MEITQTINPGTPAAAKAGFLEFSAANRVEVRVKAKPGKTAQAKAYPATYPARGEGFTLIRLVINLEIKKNPNEKSPIELHVRKRGGETTLAYLANNQWVKLDTTSQEEFLVANHPDWPSDPAIGIGNAN